MFLMTIYFSYSLTTTQTPTFGHIKWTLDVAFTGSFLHIVSVQHARQGMGEKIPPKNWNEFVIASFPCQFSPWCHVLLVKNERMDFEIKVSLGYYSTFYRNHT